MAMVLECVKRGSWKGFATSEFRSDIKAYYTGVSIRTAVPVRKYK